jgi:hypothetical protein
MITHNLAGGLGNQLFQIFTTISLAIQTAQPFYFIYQETTEGITHRTTYWNSFLNKLKPYTQNTHPMIHPMIKQNYEIIKELSFNYSPININNYNIENNDDISTTYLLDGYFQSYKYFENNFLQICNKIGVNTMQTELLPVFQNITKNELRVVDEDESSPKEYQPTISMHFRLGDYKILPLYHPIIPYGYYKNSLDFILQEENLKNSSVCVLYFCEMEDVEFVEKNYIKGLIAEFPNCVFKNTAVTLGIYEDWKNLLLMSLCCHNIIANSSFSVWGAYFNKNTNKRVCYPSKWFGENLVSTDISDIFPVEWYKISCITA